MNIIFSVTFQIICSIFLLSILIFTWKYLRRKLSMNLSLLIDLTFFFSISKIFLYYLIPSVLRLFSDMRFDVEANREPLILAQLYAIELFSWFFWLLPFFLYAYIKNSSSEHQGLNLRLDYSRRFLIFLVIGFIIVRLQLLIFGEVSGVLLLFQSVFSFVGKAAGPILLVLSLKFFNKTAFTFGFVGTLIGVASYGTRGALIYTLILLLFICFFILKNKKVNKLIIISVFSLASSYFLFGGLVGVSYSVSDDGEIKISTGLNERKVNELSPLEKIEDRFGAPTRIGSAFINMYERGDAGDGKPIINSALAFLPRAINPDKPYPNTLNGNDLYSQGMYLISKEVHGAHTFMMVEFPTGGNFYWQFGYSGVVILSFLSGLYILLSIVLYSRLGLVGVAFVFSCFKPWGYVDPKIWVSDIVLQSYQILLPSLFLIAFFKYSSLIFRVKI